MNLRKYFNLQGGRHGLETLSQLIQCEDNSCYMATDVIITDAPKYPWRGVLLDTSRNYFTVETIKFVKNFRSDRIIPAINSHHRLKYRKIPLLLVLYSDPAIFRIT